MKQIKFMNSILYKISLYISAFVPMYSLILIKFIIEMSNNNFSLDFMNYFMLTMLVVLIIIGVVAIFLTLTSNCTNTQNIKIIEIKNTTDQHFLSYFSLFVLFALTFELERVSMAIIFIMILVLIGIVYIKNNLYHINPLLNILGYSFYNITYENADSKKETLKVFYKGKIINNKRYIACEIVSNFIVLKNIK